MPNKFFEGERLPTAQECRICFSFTGVTGRWGQLSHPRKLMQFGSTNRFSNIKLVIDDDVDVGIPTPKIAHMCLLVMHNGYIYSYNFQLHEW